MKISSTYIRYGIVILIISYVVYSATGDRFPYDIDINVSQYSARYQRATKPQDVLRLYLDMDKEGGYLSSSVIKLMDKINHENLFIQQEMKDITLIDKYKIKPIKAEKDRYEYSVDYNVVAMVEDYFSYKKNISIENKKVTIVKKDDKWVISSQIFPHIGANNYLNYIRRHSDKEYMELKAVLE